MTDAEKDAAWRSLPENLKEEVKRLWELDELPLHPDYDSNSVAEGAAYILTELFGKHNLTASKEEKPRFNVGDCVKVHISNNSVYRKGDVCLVMSVIKDNNGYHYELDRSRAMLISEEFLAPYAEEQEPKIGECVDSSSSLQNEISSLSKEDAEELAKCLAEVNNFIERNQASQVDWLAYRMELAKAIAPKVICAVSDNGVSSDFCESVIDKVTTIVDGIVERLKGGDV